MDLFVDRPRSSSSRSHRLLSVSLIMLGISSAGAAVADPGPSAPGPPDEAGDAVVRRVPGAAPQLVSTRNTGVWSRVESPRLLESVSYLRVVLDLDLDRRSPPGQLTGSRVGLSGAGLPIYEVPADSLAAVRPWLVEVLGGVIVHRFASLVPAGTSDDQSGPRARVPELPASLGPEDFPQVRVTDGDFRLYTGIIHQPVPDLGQFVQSLQVSAGNAAPEGSKTISMEYRLLINNDPGTPGDIACSDYEIYLSSDARGGAVPHLLVYDNLGGATDGDFDDDAADDADIYLNYRPTDYFNDEDPNQAWHVLVYDTAGGNTGKVEYVDLRIYWRQPDSNLTVTDVYFRTAGNGGGVRVDDPEAGQDLYAHLEYTLVGPGFDGRVWTLELDGQELCSYEGPVSEGSYLGSCVAPWTVTAGAHVLTAEVDPYHVLDELDENDNLLTFEFTVPDPPDIRLDPAELTLEREMPTPIYVELDYMVAPGDSHMPSDTVLDRIRQTFQAAGYAIHLDRSDAIPHQTVIPVVGTPSASPGVMALMAQHFDHIADDRFFYSLWGHNFSYNGTWTGRSGIGDLPGRVHLVTLGSFPGNGDEDNRVGTFIHELGHNLNQKHGGGDDRLCKPNYLSIMNYYYQLHGIATMLQLCVVGPGAPTVSCDAEPPCNTPVVQWPTDASFSYSHGLASSLREGTLDERLGLGLGFCVDWDRNLCIDTMTSADILDMCSLLVLGCSNPILNQTLHDFDNWSDIEANIRNRVYLDRPGTPERCISFDEYRSLEQQLTELRARGLIPPIGKTGDRTGLGGHPQWLKSAADVITVHNDSTDLTLEITSSSLDTPTAWLDWVPSTPFSVPPGESRPLQIFADLWQAPPGHTARTLTLSSNDPDEPTVGIALGIDGLGTCTVTTTAMGGGGTTTGDVEAACGTFVTVKAFPDATFGFVSWQENGTDVSQQASYTWMLESDRTLDAVFITALIFQDGFESGDTSAW